jgi:hypothetical protein
VLTALLKGLIFGPTDVVSHQPARIGTESSSPAADIACARHREFSEGHSKRGEPHVQSETARVCHGARFGGMASVRGDEELAAAWLHRHLIRTSMARNAKQINAPVGAEVFSLAQQQFEKYGLRASNKPCDFNHIKNPYQIPVVQRSREKPRREHTGDAVCRFGSAELFRESPAKRGDFTSLHRKRES